MELNLHKVSVSAYMVIILAIMQMGGGMLFLAVYFKPFFYNTDLIRLLFISIAITMPMAFVISCFMELMMFIFTPKLLSGDVYIAAMAGIIFSLPTIYISSIAGFFINLSAKTGVGIALALYTATIPILTYLVRKNQQYLKNQGLESN